MNKKLTVFIHLSLMLMSCINKEAALAKVHTVLVYCAWMAKGAGLVGEADPKVLTAGLTEEDAEDHGCFHILMLSHVDTQWFI